jgi:hypothetical protein
MKMSQVQLDCTCSEGKKKCLACTQYDAMQRDLDEGPKLRAKILILEAALDDIRKSVGEMKEALSIWGCSLGMTQIEHAAFQAIGAQADEIENLAEQAPRAEV